MSHIAPPDGVAVKLPLAANRRVTVADIQAIVCAHYELRRADLIGHRRNHAICHPRQMAMAIACKATNMSLPEIGRRFGGRDHTTVICARRSVAARCAKFPKQQADFDALMDMVGGITRAEFLRQTTVRGRFVSARGGRRNGIP